MPGFLRVLLLILLLVYIVSPWDILPGHFLDDLILLGAYLFYQFRRGGRIPWPRHPGSAGRAYRESGRRSEEGENRQAAAGPSTGRRDPHDVLEIKQGAGPEEIHAAYRRLAQAYHPDKVAHLGKDLKELAHERFLEIQEAYRQLTGK